MFPRLNTLDLVQKTFELAVTRGRGLGNRIPSQHEKLEGMNLQKGSAHKIDTHKLARECNESIPSNLIQIKQQVISFFFAAQQFDLQCKNSTTIYIKKHLPIIAIIHPLLACSYKHHTNKPNGTCLADIPPSRRRLPCACDVLCQPGGKPPPAAG